MGSALDFLTDVLSSGLGELIAGVLLYFLVSKLDKIKGKKRKGQLSYKWVLKQLAKQLFGQEKKVSDYIIC